MADTTPHIGKLEDVNLIALRMFRLRNSPCESFHFLANVELVHPLPAAAEDELGVDIQTTINAANTTAGSGLHEASCSSDLSLVGVVPMGTPNRGRHSLAE